MKGIENGDTGANSKSKKFYVNVIKALLFLILFIVFSFVCSKTYSTENIMPDKILYLVIAATIFMVLMVIITECFSKSDRENRKEIAFIVCLYFAILFLAIHLQQNDAPDEYMRDDISLYIFNNGKLPFGNEEELCANVWGYSYAFLPYLTSVLALPLMRLFYFISPTQYSLLFAMRCISVYSIVGCAILALRIGKKVFENKTSTYLFTMILCLIPQVTFVGAYFNNDAFSLFACLSVMYCLLSGKQERWKLKNCIGLAISLSLCLLSYYNSVAWILISIPYCISGVCNDTQISNKAKFIAQRSAVIIMITAAIAGPVFIRNAILYDGDFLGMSAQHECAKIYASTGRDIYFPESPESQGFSILGMLYHMHWVIVSFKSYIAVFGYMNIYTNDVLYFIYFLIIVIGIIGTAVSLIKNRKDAFSAILLTVTIAVPVLLSIYRSYTYDFEPQGRYLLPSLPAVAAIVANGYNMFLNFLKGKRYWNKIMNPVMIAGGIWVILYVVIYMTVIIPKLVC